MQFRVNSLRSLITGTNDVSQAQPLKRRQAIIRKRRGALREVSDRVVGGDTADVSAHSSTDTTTTRSTSGGANRDVDTSPSGSSDVKQSTTPSMSEVNKGTIKRANDRGYGS